MRRDWIILLVLGSLTLGLFYPVVNFEFLNYDDDRYVTRNTFVSPGLTWRGVCLACTTVAASNWHPLTWLSHMLDCQLFGLRPGWHHAVNLLLHAANTGLLFLLLRRLTGAVWRSAVVAALFAWHPLHVESVAWIAERKDVLSAFFWMLALWAYSRYAECRMRNAECRTEDAPALKAEHATRNTRHASLFYILSLLFFALGLMSKPMVVTLPFVLILLDFWPLQRIRMAEAGPLSTRLRGLAISLLLLAREKLPFFILSALGCGVTLWAQAKGEAIASVERIPIAARVANAVVSYVTYMAKTVWPQELAVFYPYPASLPPVKVLLCGCVLVAVTGLALWQARRRPYWLTGWFWFLGTLVPVIGLVQVGDQAMADRYSYLPLIGLFIAVVWGAADLLGLFPERRLVAGIAASALLAGSAVATSLQLPYWRDAATLFERALAVTSKNHVAHNNLAVILFEEGNYAAARDHLANALVIVPDYALAHYNLANTYAKLAEGAVLTSLPSALRTEVDAPRDSPPDPMRLSESLRLKPDSLSEHRELQERLMRSDDFQRAVAHFTLALKFKPDFADAHLNWACLLELVGKPAEAEAHYRAALQLAPDSAHVHSNLGVLLAKQGKPAEAIGHFQKVVSLEPQNANAHYNLGNALLSLGQYAQATSHYAEVLTLGPADEAARRKLALCRARQAGAAPTGGVP